MERTPPVETRRSLRREVNFGCPVAGCANPYLEYHHFDPPWREAQHHNPEGMLALCAEHHRKADAGAFTVEQLRGMKQPSGSQVTGRFDWLRNEILAVVGGNFYHETPVIFEYKGEKAIWFERDADGNMLLNIRMVTGSGQPRLSLRNNDWIVLGSPVDFESPPSGKRIHAKYDNGDTLTVEFFVLPDLAATLKRYPGAANPGLETISYPITAVEVQELFGGTDWGFGPTWTRLGGMTMTNCFSSRCGVGISFS
jgi:hypothetical protein